MNIPNNQLMAIETDPPSVIFREWPMDMDDDEFRAGYPFTPDPMTEVDEQETCNDSPTTSTYDASEFIDSQNSGSSPTKNADDQSKWLASGKQEKQDIDFATKSSVTHHHPENGLVEALQKTNLKEHEKDNYYQSSIVQTNRINNKQLNQAYLPKQKHD